MKRAVRFTESDTTLQELQNAEEPQIFRSLRQFHNHSITENGARGYRTTTKPLLDLNFMVSSLRSRDEAFITNAFVKAYYDTPTYAVKWLFFLRDIEKGLGERRTFRICMKYLTVSHPAVAKAVMALIPEYGRYDDLLVFFHTPLQKDACAFIQKQLQSDLSAMQEKKPVSLLAKWLPSINTSSKTSRQNARLLAQYLKMSDREYRKALASLRAYLDVCEVKISASKWQELDYHRIPAKANLKYENAFERHDYDRRLAYLTEVFLGNEKLNSNGIQPHEVVHRLMDNSYGLAKKDDPLAELMWQKLREDGLKNDWGLKDCIVVADGSGSMFSPVSRSSRVQAIDVCNALAIYFAEQLNGIFRDKAITFSMHPQFIDLSKGHSLREKLEIMLAYDECSNTDIEAVFDLLLHLAVSHQVPAGELPKQVLILSDMEFDYSVAFPNKKLFPAIEKKYEAAGYSMPRLIFWNLCGRSDTIPMVENGSGLCLLSGFSQNAMKTAQNSKIRDPYLALLEVLDGPRYDKVAKAIKSIAS